MPDTMRGDFPDRVCSDCKSPGDKPVFIKHWGPLVPSGEVGYFGPDCWEARQLLDKAGNPRPLGTKYEHSENLADDMYYVRYSSDKLQGKLNGDREKLLALLARVNAAKGRFAGPRQMFEEAARLRDIERQVQQKLQIGE